MNIGSLFSGIGGLELGLEWAGLGPVVWQVESDSFCRRVLAKHWPDVDRSVTDVRAASATNLRRVDLICGGFPCQDVSSAGKRAGLEGERSSLWREFRRIVAELTPRVVVVENVASGARRWLCSVRSDLHALGYRTRAIRLGACDVGAPHRRFRVFVLADAHTQSSNVWETQREALRDATRRARWTAEPAMGRVADGLSRRLDRRRREALANAVVPQCAEVVGRVITAAFGGQQ